MGCVSFLLFRDKRGERVALPDMATALQHVPEPAYAEDVRVLAAGVVQLASEVRDVHFHQVLRVASL